jgi:hypothetical protein
MKRFERRSSVVCVVLDGAKGVLSRCYWRARRWGDEGNGCWCIFFPSVFESCLHPKYQTGRNGLGGKG